MSYGLKSVGLIARNELNRTIFNPIVIIVGVIVLFLAFVYGYGGSMPSAFSDGQSVFFIAYCQNEYSILLICNIMAAFLGGLSIAQEQWNHSDNVLLVKPLYRRDFILGKFIGLTGFIFIFVSVILVFTSVMQILYLGSPPSYVELLFRLSAYIFTLSLECSLVMALTMLTGTLCRNVMGSISLVVIYLYTDWFKYTTAYMGGFSIIMPHKLYEQMADPFTVGYPQQLFNTLVPLTSWLNNAMPYILFTLLEIIILVLISCYVITKSDDS
jgi:ABC-2 type transport system permease protein